MPWPQHRYLIIGLIGLILLVGCTLIAKAFVPQLVYYAFLPALAAVLVLARLTRQR